MKRWPVQSYCTTFAVAAIAMTAYEAAKEVFSGGALSAWESHAITIIVTASIAVIANVFMRRATTRAVVTERLAIEDELRRINDQLRLSDRILKVAEEGVLVTDANGRIEAINPAFTAITGYSEADVLGKQPSLLKSEHHSPDFFRKMWADLIRDRRWSGEIMNRHKNGEVYILWMTVIAIQENDGRVSHYVSVFRNITEAHEKEARIRYLAFHDALTGLHNRLLFEERLATQSIAHDASVRPLPSFSSTLTASKRSTMLMATMPGMRCSRKWADGSALGRAVIPTPSPGLAGTSSSS